MKKIAILGSTGSIGTQTLDVVRNNTDLEVVSLVAGSNIELMEQQIKEFHPKMVSIWDEKKALELKQRLQGESVEILTGMDGMIACAIEPEVEIVVAAVVGMIGKPSMLLIFL